MRLRHRLELRLQLAERQLELVVDLAVDRDLPLVRLLGRLRNLAVVADEELRGRRGVVVEQMLRRLGHQRTLAEHARACRPCRGISDTAGPSARRARGGARRLRQRRRDQPARHVGRERNRAADRGARRRRGPRRRESRGDRRRSCGRRPSASARSGSCCVQLFDRSARISWHRPSRLSSLCIDSRLDRSLAAPILTFKILNEWRAPMSQLQHSCRNPRRSGGVLLWCGAKAACKLATLRDRNRGRSCACGSGLLLPRLPSWPCRPADAAPRPRRAVQTYDQPGTMVDASRRERPHPHQDPGAEALLSRRRHRGDAGRQHRTPSDRQLPAPIAPSSGIGPNDDHQSAPARSPIRSSCRARTIPGRASCTDCGCASAEQLAVRPRASPSRR